jgi:hypothetical protein
MERRFTWVRADAHAAFVRKKSIRLLFVYVITANFFVCSSGKSELKGLPDRVAPLLCAMLIFDTNAEVSE